MWTMIIRGNDQAGMSWRIIMSMERERRQPTKSIHVSGSVTYPNNFLKKAPVGASSSKLVFACDSPGNFHPLFRLPSALGTPHVPFPKGKQDVFSTWIKRSHLLRTRNPYLGGGWPSITWEAHPGEDTASQLEWNSGFGREKELAFPTPRILGLERRSSGSYVSPEISPWHCLVSSPRGNY